MWLVTLILLGIAIFLGISGWQERERVLRHDSQTSARKK